MSAQLWILVATAVLAVVAVSAAIIALRAARRLAATSATGQAPTHPAPISGSRPAEPRTTPSPRPSADLVVLAAARTTPGQVSRVVEGRVVTPPSEQQVLATAMGRPGVRLSILAHGVAHAMRAESRDRISAMMRREYRRRRRERQQAGRRAVRAAQPTSSSDQWLGS